MFLRPFEQFIEHGSQRHGGGRDLVFDARRDLRKHRALDQPVGFQIAQLHGQHMLGDFGNSPAQLAETMRTLTELPQDFTFPLPCQHSQCSMELAQRILAGANRNGFLAIGLVFHTTPEKASYLSKFILGLKSVWRKVLAFDHGNRTPAAPEVGTMVLSAIAVVAHCDQIDSLSGRQDIQPRMT